MLGSNWDDPQTLAAFAAAQALLSGSKGDTMGRLANAGSAYGGTLEQRKSVETERQRRMAETLLMQQRVQQLLADQEAAKQQAQEAARVRGLIANAGVVTPEEALSAGGGPTVDNAAKVGQSKPIDFVSLFRQGVPASVLEDLRKTQTMGMDKVARTIEIPGPNGEKLVQQLDEFGRPVGAPRPAYVAPQLVNLGDKQVFTTPQSGLSLDVGMSPSERDASARGWAGVKQAAARLDLDRGSAVADVGGPGQADLVKRFGKPPKDYRWKPDGIAEPIPGGPADIKAGEAGAKAEQRRQASTLAATNVLGIVKEAKDLVGPTTAGFGAWTAAIPASDARNLAAKLETIKANLGFDRLQQMRDMSPTGGALGQVAVQELVALQSTVASLDQAQSPSQLRQALDKIERHYNNWLKTVNQGGASGTWDGAEKVLKYNPATGRLE